MRIQPSLLAILAGIISTAIPTLARQKVLLYSRTVDFRHDSIPTALRVIKSLGENNDPGFDSYATEDPDLFEKKNWLNQFDALIFVSASGEILSKKGQAQMRKYIEAGGGYMGIHESCGALFHQPWYGRLVGAYFNYHPEICSAKLNVMDRDHPATAHLNKTWWVYDEMYNFLSDPRAYGRKVVLSVDEGSYSDPVMSLKDRIKMQGSPHPIAWYKEGGLLNARRHKHVGGGTDNNASLILDGTAGSGGDGRSFYTALGHSNETWEDPIFQEHIYGAIRWVLASDSISSSGPDVPSWRPGQKYKAPASASHSSTSKANTATAKATIAAASTPRPSSNPGLQHAAGEQSSKSSASAMINAQQTLMLATAIVTVAMAVALAL